jgi:pimeloyl-ACP methyl ester carboxylesterase/SAM-dependent methyltransferase
MTKGCAPRNDKGRSGSDQTDPDPIAACHLAQSHYLKQMPALIRLLTGRLCAIGIVSSPIGFAFALVAAGFLAVGCGSARTLSPGPVMETVTSRDGTRIAYWKSGSGPPLVLVHGTTADHTRWAGILPELERHFTVYAVDRRGRGGSGDAPEYAIEREFEDVAAVVEAIEEPVFLLGHSYGALVSLEAALLTGNVRRLILYEPPLPAAATDLFSEGVLDRIQLHVDRGELEAGLTLFFREVVRMPDHEFEVYSKLPAWQVRIGMAPTIPRESFAEMGYQFDPARLAELRVPTLLMMGGDSPAAFRSVLLQLHDALPESRVVVLEGQQHVAMDTAPELFLGEVKRFLLADDASGDATGQPAAPAAPSVSDPQLQAQIGAAGVYEELFVPALFGEWAARVADTAAIQPGERVLDVACGTGVLAREAATRVAPGGSVTGLDPNPGMLAVAARLAPEIAWHRGTAEDIPFPDASFDVVVSQFGLMFFEDKEKAVREMVRVLAPGGRLAVAVWSPLDDIPAYAAEVDLLRRLAGDRAGEALRLPFAYGDPDQLAALFDGAGVEALAVTTHTGTARFPNVRAMVEPDLRGWLPLMGVELDGDLVDLILDEAETTLIGYSSEPSGFVFPIPARVVTATRARGSERVDPSLA